LTAVAVFLIANRLFESLFVDQVKLLCEMLMAGPPRFFARRLFTELVFTAAEQHRMLNNDADLRLSPFAVSALQGDLGRT
jgi:hypothetical protein